MNESEQEQKVSIYELLPRVQRALGGIQKGQKNTQRNYNFRGIDDLLNAIGPHLAREGVLLDVKVSKHTLREVETEKGFRVCCTLKMRVRFIAPDGSSTSSTTYGEAMDYNGDKATNKAMSVAFKYAFFLGLAIPLEPGVLEDSDHDGDYSDRPKASSAPSARRPPQAKQAAKKAAKRAAKKAAKKAGNKLPPNQFDGKPITQDQADSIKKLIIQCSTFPDEEAGEDEDYVDEGEVAKIRNGMIRNAREMRAANGEGEGPAKLDEMTYFEAERAIRILKTKLSRISS